MKNLQFAWDDPETLNGPDPRNACCWLTMPQTLEVPDDKLCTDCLRRKATLASCMSR